MKQRTFHRSPETLTTVALLIGSIASIIFMNSLVAPPRALFGRSLSAIEPSLFPTIALVIMAILCALALLLIYTGTVAEQDAGMTRGQWTRAVLLFGIMILYALTMLPLGFLISTTIAIILISLQMGERSVLQIVLVAAIGPVALYLAATRLLAVSLPELVAIEQFYANIFNFFSSPPPQSQP